MMKSLKYPIYKPSITDKEKLYVNDCLESGWISSKGPYVDRFEDEFSKFLNINHSVSVSSGTTALHLAMLALNIKKGDEVILPSLTFVATANAVRYCGATPIFADVNKDTYVIETANLQEMITDKTKAIVAVHLYGNSCEMNSLVDFCKKNNIYLIEDCAEAIGTKYKNEFVGTFGDISCFSFYGNKTISTGEGGMVCTNNVNLAKKVTLLKQQGFKPLSKSYYNHIVIGYNYRMTNICAAIGLAQLENIEFTIQKKNNLANLYKNYLKNSDDLLFQTTTPNSTNSFWLVSATCEKNERYELALYLESKNIETRPFFTPLNLLEIYQDSKQETPNANLLSKKGISLPSYPELEEEDILYISSKVIDYFQL